MKRISLDVDAPTTSFSVPENLVNIRILCTGVYSKSEDPESISRFAMDVGEQKELFFFMAGKKRTLLKSNFSFIGDGYYNNTI